VAHRKSPSRRESSPQVPTFSLHEWAPFSEAFTRIVASVGTPTLAGHRLYQDALDGRLEWAQVEILPDGKEALTLLKPSDWRQRRVWVPIPSEERAYVTLVGEIEPVSGHFFVRRAGLNKRYPTTTSTPPTTGDHPADDKPRRKPGTKAKDDWPMLVAAKLINIARYDPEALENVDALIKPMQDFLKDEIGWWPQDRKQVREKLVFLLQFVRR
jgi:hypothetical protein